MPSRDHRFPGLTDTLLLRKRPTSTPPDVLAHPLQPEDVPVLSLIYEPVPGGGEGAVMAAARTA
jgi:hypothetical protein